MQAKPTERTENWRKGESMVSRPVTRPVHKGWEGVFFLWTGLLPVGRQALTAFSSSSWCQESNRPEHDHSLYDSME